MESISLEQCDAELTSANDIPKDSTQASNIDLSSNHTSGLIAAQVDLQVTSPLDDTFTLSEPEPRVGWKTFDETTISYDFDFPLVPSPPQTPPGSPKRDNITPTRTPRKKDALRRETLLFSHEEGGLAQGVEEAGGALLTVLRGMLTIGLDGGALIASSIYFILPSKLREKVDSLDPIVQVCYCCDTENC